MLWQSRLVLHDVACIECNLAQDTNAGFQWFPHVAISCTELPDRDCTAATKHNEVECGYRDGSGIASSL